MWAEWENISPQVSVSGAETSVNVVKQVLAATFDSQHLWTSDFLKESFHNTEVTHIAKDY